MSEVRRYRKRPVECEAMLLDGYGSFVRARDWINNNGGAAYTILSEGVTPDKVSIVTIDGNVADVLNGWYVVRGITGEFYPCRADIFEASHEAVEVPEAKPPTGTGLYARGAPSDSQRLVGGVAKQVPVDRDDYGNTAHQ